jgi:hypothetical protein
MDNLHKKIILYTWETLENVLLGIGFMLISKK